MDAGPRSPHPDRHMQRRDPKKTYNSAPFPSRRFRIAPQSIRMATERTGCPAKTTTPLASAPPHIMFEQAATRMPPIKRRKENGRIYQRRSFLVGAAGAVAAAGLAGCAPQPSGQAAAGERNRTFHEAWDQEADVVIIGSARAERLLLVGAQGRAVLLVPRRARGSRRRGHREPRAQIARRGDLDPTRSAATNATSDQFKAFLKALRHRRRSRRAAPTFFVYRGPEMCAASDPTG